MKKMKQAAKVFSFLLALLMVLSVCPFAVFAADGDEAALTANNTTTSYATIQAALDALDLLYDAIDTATLTDANANGLDDELYAAAGNPVISLKKDVTVTKAIIPDWADTAANTTTGKVEYDMNAVRTIVLDGTKAKNGDKVTERYKIFNNSDTYFFERLAFSNTTFSNIEFDIKQTGGDGKFSWNGNFDQSNTNTGVVPGTSDTVFQNCKFTNTYTGGNNDGGLFKMNGKAHASLNADGSLNDICPTDIFNITFDGCEILDTAAQSLQVHWGATANIQIKNTTWTLNTGKSTNGNFSILKSYNNAATAITVDGKSALINRPTSGSKMATLIHEVNSTKGNITVNLAQGAQMILDPQVENMTALTFIAENQGGAKITVIDNGAVWKAGSSASVANTVTLPTSTRLASAPTDSIIWKANGADVTDINYALTAGTEVTFTPMSINDPSLNPANIAYIAGATAAGNQYFTTLANAVNAVTSNETIHLLRDTTVASYIIPSWLGTYDPANMRTVKIDGAKADGTNAKITVSAGFFKNMAYYNLEMSNVDMIFNAVGTDGIFNWEAQCTTDNASKNSQAQTTKFTNCTFTTPDGNALDSNGGGNFFKMKGNGKEGTDAAGDLDVYTLILDGCTLTDNSGNIIMIHHGTSANITIKDSIVKHIGGAQSDNICVIKAYECDSVIVNILGNSVIESALPEGAPLAKTHMFTWMSTVNKEKTQKLVLDATATLYLNSADNKTENKFINNAIGNTLVVEDKGVTYKASATMLQKGIYLPENTIFTNTVLGYTNGTALASKGGEQYTVANATEEGTFRAVTVSTFKMLTGASIHTSGTYGIRFETEISKDLADMLGADISLHMWIMPEEWLNGSFIKTSLYEGEYLTFDLGADQITATGTDTTTYSGDLLGVSKTTGGVTTRFTARAFLKISYADGTTGYVYADYDKTANSRSIAEVAQAAYDAGMTDNAMINEILALKG